MNQPGKGRPSLRYELAGSNPQRVAHNAPHAAGPRILVVDDDPDMTRLVSAALGAAGLECLAAYDALQGMVVAQREHPAVILLDLHMPAGGGLKLLEKLRASVKTATTPVLMITADHASDLPEKAAALGATGFLYKPLDLTQLVDQIRPHLTPAA
ncbi:MAG: response regulator [Gemmatimonadales bacterium]